MYLTKNKYLSELISKPYLVAKQMSVNSRRSSSCISFYDFFGGMYVIFAIISLDKFLTGVQREVVGKYVFVL